MNLEVCKFYLKGNCKRGNRCRFIHQSSYVDVLLGIKKSTFPLLPKEIFVLIFENQYISDLRLVCKSWQITIERDYPLQLYVYSNIGERDYSYKCAVSIARCKLDAILNICKRCFTIKSNPECTERYDDNFDIEEPLDDIFSNKIRLYMKVIKYWGKDGLMWAKGAYSDLMSETPYILPINKCIAFYASYFE